MFAAMTREQRRLVEAMRATTNEFAVLARSRDEFIGGMQWLTVKGNDYLARYRRDPVTGEQKSTSLGRRSPETEALYGRFISGRADLDLDMEEIKPAVAEQTRMAKALRLSRTPSEIADVARAIGLSNLIDHVTIVGESAVYGYECELAALLPRELLPSDGMDLLVAGLDPDDVIDEVVAALRRGRVGVRRRGEAELRTEEGLQIRLLTPSMLDRSAERYAEDNYGGGEAARWALEQPSIRTIFIDRQGRAAPVSLPDPRAWCILRYMAVDLGEMSVGAREIPLELNSTMVRLVQERWPEPFDEAHVMSFGHLAEALEGESHPSPRI
jgi:Nucleotidyltransferase